MSEGTILPHADQPQPTFNDHINEHGGIKDTQQIGTSVIVTYVDGTSEVMPRDVFGTTATAAGSGNALGYAQLANTQANQAAAQAAQQQSLAETIRQFNEQMGMDKAKYNTNVSGHDAMGNPTLEAELGRGGLDVSRGNLDVSRGNLALQQQIQAFKQYSDLANLASNPRNFVQSFFMNRGAQPPPDVARYGNTNQNASQIVPFSQWQQSGQMGGQAPQANTQAFQGQAFATGQGNAYSGLNHFNQNGTITLAQNDPDAARLMAKNPSLYTMGPNYGLPTANYAQTPSPAPAQTAAPAPDMSIINQQIASGQPLTMGQKMYQQPKMMARGGRVTMYVPHALVNLATGKVAAIAGERGMENADFDGAALIDPTLQDPYGDPYADSGGGSAPVQNQPVGGTGNASDPGQGSAPPPYQTMPPQPAPVPTGSDMVTPGTPGGPVSYGQPVPSQMPSYLAGENFTAQSGVTDAVRNLPFMRRVWAQARGDQSQGTNVPQQTNLPSDLPLLSHLAWTQLDPGEQEAFLSYVSALGVDPKTYLQMIANASPSGGYAQAPTFGSPINYSRQ